MQGSVIRHLAISDEQSIVAAALFERTVQIWSWETQRLLGEFQSLLDFGGRRLALTKNGTICITGSWTSGLAAFALPHGEALWHRKDIKHIQHVSVDASDRVVYCGLESNRLLTLDVNTGTEVDKPIRALRVVPSECNGEELVVKKDRYLLRGRNELEIPAASFALHTAAFAPDTICLSEPTAGSRCVSLHSGETIWHHSSIHFNHAAFNHSDQQFYCVTGFETDPHQTFLVRLASELEECDVMVELGRTCWEEAFTPSGRILITADGGVYDTSTGLIRARLEFPQREYPNAN
jgi:hypothetical protein